MSNVFTEHVAPSIGNCLATAMLTSPFPAVLRIRKTGQLGDVNTLPFVFTVVNAMGWVAYGLSNANPYMFPANIIGFIVGIFFTLTAHDFSTRQVRDRTMAILLAAALHFIVLSLIGCYALSKSAAIRMWGTNAEAILMCYYLVPLSTMYTIIKTRSASSIYPPLAVTAVANGTAWTVYGLAIKDINLWLPNGFGAIIGVLQLVLRLRYGGRPPPMSCVVNGDVPHVELPLPLHASMHHQQQHEELAVASRSASGTGLLASTTHGHSHHHPDHHHHAPDVEGGKGRHNGGQPVHGSGPS